MGRYYNGDIKGKFLFAVQSSTDASFFGGSENEPNYISYYFEKSDLLDIEKGLKKCKKALGEYEKKLDVFFERVESYNNEMLRKELNVGEKKVEELLEWYARKRLGEKILKCVKEKGTCEFDAEL